MVLIIFPNTMSQSLAVEPPTGRKNMRAPRQVRVTCTMILKDGKPVFRGAGAPHLPRSNGGSWACVARNLPAGAVQSAQWRELDSSSSRATAESPAVMRCARRLSHLWCSSLSGGTADGEKDMRASRPQTPRQVRITCTSANRVCRLLRSEIWCRCAASAAIQRRKLGVRSTKSPRRSGPIRSMART